MIEWLMFAISFFILIYIFHVIIRDAIADGIKKALNNYDLKDKIYSALVNFETHKNDPDLKFPPLGEK